MKTPNQILIEMLEDSSYKGSAEIDEYLPDFDSKAFLATLKEGRELTEIEGHASVILMMDFCHYCDPHELENKTILKEYLKEHCPAAYADLESGEYALKYQILGED